MRGLADGAGTGPPVRTSDSKALSARLCWRDAISRITITKLKGRCICDGNNRVIGIVGEGKYSCRRLTSHSEGSTDVTALDSCLLSRLRCPALLTSQKPATRNSKSTPRSNKQGIANCDRPVSAKPSCKARSGSRTQRRATAKCGKFGKLPHVSFVYGARFFLSTTCL